MGGIASCVSNLMYLTEKFTLFLACTSLICCLVLTITVTLGMGVGLGYNYCFVDMKTKFKYVRGHYIYPGSPRWPYKRQGNAAEEPAFDEMAEDDELRRLPQEPDKVISNPDDIDLTVRHQYLQNNNNTGNGIAMDYHTAFPDTGSFNGTESSKIDALTNDEVTKIIENSPVINSSSNTASATEIETKIIDEADESTSESSIVNKEQPTSSPGNRKVKKLVIPITGLDLISLLSKLRAENRNYSLQIVTT